MNGCSASRSRLHSRRHSVHRTTIVRMAAHRNQIDDAMITAGPDFVNVHQRLFYKPRILIERLPFRAARVSEFVRKATAPLSIRKFFLGVLRLYRQHFSASQTQPNGYWRCRTSTGSLNLHCVFALCIRALRNIQSGTAAPRMVSTTLAPGPVVPRILPFSSISTQRPPICVCTEGGK